MRGFSLDKRGFVNTCWSRNNCVVSVRQQLPILQYDRYPSWKAGVQDCGLTGDWFSLYLIYYVFMNFCTVWRLDESFCFIYIKNDCVGAQLVALAHAPLCGELEDKFWLKR